MKLTTLMVLFLACGSALAQNPYPNFRRVNTGASDGMYFEGNDETKFVVSKTRFGTQEEAAAYCAAHFLPLADEVVIAVLTIAGAEQNADLRRALAFNFTRNGRTASGVWAWSKVKQQSEVEGRSVVNDVLIWADGSGWDVEYANFSDIRRAIPSLNVRGLPAICGSIPDLPTEDPSVNDSSRGANRSERESNASADQSSTVAPN